MVQVSVEEGLLEGEVLDNVLGGKYYSFKGIPYAEPPIGELRFKAPKPRKPWHGVRNAKEHGPVCYQFDFFCQSILEGSEDCLYLNVYSPNLKPKKPLPVMFWIHGGGFLSGSGNTNYYGADFLVNKDVVLVTINYRLEVLGFLCLDTDDVPGNAGMKDQVAALKWTKQNINNFGGDPNNITIFGESAGGACVGYHLVSPLTKGLFQRAILQSGTNLNEWAINLEPRQRAENLARELGCKSFKDKELYDFFKSLPVEKLVATRPYVLVDEKTDMKLNLFFTVVNEKAIKDKETFFHGDMHDVLSSRIHEGVDVMVGYTIHEGTANRALTQKPLEVINNFMEYFVPLPMTYQCTPLQQLEIGKKMKQYYFGKSDITKADYDRLIDYISFNIMTYGILRWAKICANMKRNNVFLYKFDCYSERNIFAKIFNCYMLNEKRAVAHCDDLPYLFNMEELNIPVNKKSKSYKMIQNVTKLWTDFARFGNPTQDRSMRIKWPTFDKTEKFVVIGDDITVSSFPEKEDIEFWDKLYDEYLPRIIS